MNHAATPRTLRLGTRRSQLALAQAGWVADRLRAACGVNVVLVTMSTKGDESDAPISRIGSSGVFVTALREALLRDEVDFVVHSYKDLPSAQIPELVVAAVPEREDPRDALVWRGGATTLDALPPGTRVGTGAPRRVAQLRAGWPGLSVVPLRGNVDSRLRKVTDGELDAVVVAMAGLSRLGRLGVVSAPLPASVLLPAPAQGALAVECAADNLAVVEALSTIDDWPTRSLVTAERAFLTALDAGCSAAVAAHAELAAGYGDGPTLRVRGLVATPDGSRVLRREVTGGPARADELGRHLAGLLLDDGARALLDHPPPDPPQAREPSTVNVTHRPHRPRRLRRSAALRRLTAETRLSPADLVLPLFVRDGLTEPVPVRSMPGVVQHTRDSLRKAARAAVEAGVGGLMLFGVPDAAGRDATGSAAIDPDGVLNVAIRDVVAEVGDATVVMADLCLDEFTDHGHCGVLTGDGEVDNDATVDKYAAMAICQAEAGVHLVGPSGMMDAQVGAVRRALDGAGHQGVGILAYAAKYASAFYGPFREAVDSSLRGDRKTYQMDPANAVEAHREVRLDVAESADIVMVKPASAYLDIVRRVADQVDVPVAAYQVSGEYAMVEAAAAKGWLDRDRTVLETLTSIRRAGASIILSYWAADVARLLLAEGLTGKENR